MKTKHMSATLAAIIVLLLGIILLLGQIGSEINAALAVECPAPAGRADTPVLAKPVKATAEPELWRITAYCGCAECCGEYANNRPEGKVVGAAGVELVQGVSCAARGLPFGTVVQIDGLGEYVVQDRTSTAYAERHDGRVIDLYFTDHRAAVAFGVKYLEVEVKPNGNDR